MWYRGIIYAKQIGTRNRAQGLCAWRTLKLVAVMPQKSGGQVSPPLNFYCLFDL
jgi:hypothetical protein